MRPVFAQSSETTKILGAFLDMTMNQQMTFAELSETVGFKVFSITPAYHSARKIAERDHEFFIASSRGRGFFRGNAVDMADSLRAMSNRTRRIAKKGVGRADLAIKGNLPPEEYHRTCEMRNRFSIIHATSAAPFAASNRPRKPKVPLAPKGTQFPFAVAAE
jgi:hypothetical protein